MFCDRIWLNAHLATLRSDRPGIGELPNGIVACRDSRIVYAGAVGNAPPDLLASDRVDCAGRWITPGLIDCHTHLIHAGDRSHEFELRLRGSSYDEIARAGGGILSTMRATRAASEEALVETALGRLDALIAEGVTTVEVKSGYGLDLDTERKQLRAASELERRRPVTIVATFLGAHALPPEAADADSYIDLVCTRMIPAVAAEGLAETVDAFCETHRLFSRADRAGIRGRGSARPEGAGCTPINCRTGAARRSRLGSVRSRPITSNTPTKPAFVRWPRPVSSRCCSRARFTFCARPCARPSICFVAHGVPIAVATDCNPGTSPLTSLLLALNIGTTLFGLTVDECIAGATREAARALGRLSEIGTIEAGKLCDLAIWDIDRPAELVYRMGFNPLHARVWRGQ